jgi:hypothetical protein
MSRYLLTLLMSATMLLSHSFICIVVQPGSALAQTGQNTDNAQAAAAASDKIRKRVRDLRVGANVTVIMLGGKKYYGTISDIAADNFQVAEVDLKQNVSFNYGEVKKVAEGYGRKSVFSGKRGVNPNNHWVRWVVLGALVAIPIIITANVKN